MTIDEIKMKVIDLEWAVMEKNSVDRRYFQQEIFDEIQNLHVMLQASEADRDSWRQRCEMQGRKIRMLEEASVRRMANIYGETHAKPMNLDFEYHDDDPMESRLEAKHAFDDMFDGCTPDDLPFPDVEELAPAEEVEGANE